MNSANDFPISHFGYFLFILLPLFFLLYKLGIHKWRSGIIALLRMIAQLSFAGFYLTYLFRYDNGIFNFCYFLFMVLVSSHAISSNADLSLRRSMPLIYLANFLPQISLIIFMHTFLIHLEKTFSARYFIPLGGMLLGNSLNASIIALRTFFDSLQKDMDIYRYRLSLGCNKWEAVQEVFQKSLTTAISPIIGSMSSMGLVSLPGMMTGQILGGAEPMIAIKYQVMIVLAIFSVIVFSAILSLLLFIHFSFDSYSLPKKEYYLK